MTNPAPYHPLHGTFTPVDGRKMFSRGVAGNEEVPLVLVHGLVISSLYMIPLARALAAKSARGVHAPDLPGFGASAGPPSSLTIPQLAAALLHWMTATRIERCHLIANSLGCQVAAHCAVMAPERILSLVLIGATTDPAAHAFGTQIRRLLHDALHEPASLWVRWLYDFARAGLPRALGTTRAMFADRIEKLLPEITAPALIMRGETDPTMPQSWGECAAALLPAGSLEMIAGAPHCAHYTHPAAVAELCLRHAARAEETSTRPPLSGNFRA